MDTTQSLYRIIRDRSDWLRLTAERVLTGWYTDPDLRHPATTDQVERAGEDIYTRYGWNTEPRTYPVLAHIESTPHTIGGGA